MKSKSKKNQTPLFKRRRKANLIAHVVGLTLTFCGLFLIAAGVFEFFFGDTTDWQELLMVGCLTSVSGYVLSQATYIGDRIARIEVFVAVSASWLVMSIIGSLPYFFTGTFDSYDQALFESISGLTTTGATVFDPAVGTEMFNASKGILMWRAMSQWIGGMGVIVLVVAILPAVGNWGMGLLSAEAPGPTGERLTPRVKNTARNLWIFYLAFTVVVFIAYLFAGMNFFEASTHSLTTVSTGGFSIYTGSIAHFESALIEWIAIAAMFVAGSSFSLIYKLIRGNPTPLLKSFEFKLYCFIFAGATIFIYFTNGDDVAVADGIRNAMFNVATITSTTGYGTVDFVNNWPEVTQMILFILLPLGAMAGSTSGGLKLIRILIVASFTRRELLVQLHPGLIRPVRLGKSVIEDKVAHQVVGFVMLTLGLFALGAVLISLTGESLITSFSASATAIGNVGPGFDAIGPSNTFIEINPFGRAVAMIWMILGRLEIYPVIIALTQVSLPRLNFAKSIK